jgi:lipopolysaccharide/colanic/teichoic acid biosynthesis glycosyltransferase
MDFKRLFDFLSSVIGLVILSPVFLSIAVLIKITSSGPVLHRAQRIGLNGKPFRLYKFRTMVNQAAQLGPGITASADPRITAVGRILRRLKLDELPQLVNVLAGEMSLVGPRPEDPRYVAAYSADQKRALSVRPGITSQASIYYRSEENLLTASSPEDVYLHEILPKKLAMDVAYVDRHSFWLDLKILLETALALLR